MQDGWYSLHIAFDSSRVAARVQTPGEEVFKLIAETDSSTSGEDGAVGMSAFNCGGVAFDGFQMSPLGPKFEGLHPTSLFNPSKEEDTPAPARLW